MGWFKRNEGAKPSANLPSAAQAKIDPPLWDVALLTDYVHTSARDWEQRTVDPTLVEARLGDRMRDEQLRPLSTTQFAQLVGVLDEQAWRRMALAVGAFDLPEVRGVLPILAAIYSLDQRVYGGLVQLAAETDVLSLTLLGQSVVRAEEFARHFASQLGVEIRDESPDQSRAILDRISYRRLLAEAERARDSAEEQLEYLRKLQEAQDSGRRRGKW
jgi:hypothetical protein